MPQVKIITKAAYDALQSANVSAQDQLRDHVDPGIYRIFLTSLEGVSAEMTVPEVSTLSAQRVGGFQSSGSATTSPTFNIDTSGLVAGDVLYFCYGAQSYATAATVNDTPATKISTDAGNIGAGRATAFSYSLQAGDIGASITVEITAETNNAHIFDCWVVSGGMLADIQVNHHAINADPVTVTLAVSSAPNIILVWGVGTWDAPMTYAGVIEVETNDSLPTASTRAMAVGSAENVAAGSHAVTLTPGVEGHLGVIAMVLEAV